MSNVQYPIANFEIGYSTLDILHFPRRGPDTRYEDRDGLITLASHTLEFGRGGDDGRSHAIEIRRVYDPATGS